MRASLFSYSFGGGKKCSLVFKTRKEYLSERFRFIPCSVTGKEYPSQPSQFVEPSQIFERQREAKRSVESIK